MRKKTEKRKEELIRMDFEKLPTSD